MPAKLNLAGHNFGRLTVMRPSANVGSRTAWMCECECGQHVVVTTLNLRKGETKSCGCLQRDRARDANLKHGNGGSWRGPKPRIYRIWANMKSRCLNPNVSSYENYGGRGITVCDEWMEFKPFLEWAMKNGYRDGLTLDRKNNDLGYSPENCRWTTSTVQANNSRRNHLIEYEGRTMTVSEAARRYGFDYDVLKCRLRSGWSAERALTEPLNRTRSHPTKRAGGRGSR